MNFKHGDACQGRVTQLHKRWRKMLERCSAASVEVRPRYAGRGIAVCAEWKDYLAFKTWALAHGYADHLSIERIDNDGDYEPSNCKWVPRVVQARNRCSSRRVTFAGRTMILSEWARELGVDPGTISYRLKTGWDVARALSAPPRSKRHFQLDPSAYP